MNPPRSVQEELWWLSISNLGAPAHWCVPSPAHQLNMQNLKDRARWVSGWVQKKDLRALSAQASLAPGGKPCKQCEGQGTIPCPVCSAGGVLIEL